MAAIVKPAQFDQAVVGDFTRQIVERITQKMYVAALPISFGKHFGDGTLKPRMIVADGEDDPAQPASFQAKKGLFPARRTFPIGHLYAEDLTPAFPIGSNSHQHGPRTDHPVLAQLLIARIDNQIGILTLELAPGKAPKFGANAVEGRLSYRSGITPAVLVTRVGKLELRVPQNSLIALALKPYESLTTETVMKGQRVCK